MNSLILFAQELTAADTAVVRGERASRIINEHGLAAGTVFRAGVLNGRRGVAQVQEVASSEVVLRLSLTEGPITRDAGVLIVAVPRPQTVKKVIHIATTLGVSEVHFVRASHGIKSYLQSKALTDSAIQEEIVKGLEQACDTMGPEVIVHEKFVPFIEDSLASIIGRYQTAGRFIAHTQPVSYETESEITFKGPAIFAVGPEAGWTDYEVKRLRACSFTLINLGQRILRVETAVAVLLGWSNPDFYIEGRSNYSVKSSDLVP